MKYQQILISLFVICSLTAEIYGMSFQRLAKKKSAQKSQSKAQEPDFICQAGIFTPIRVNFGNIECLSYDGVNCQWQTDDAKCSQSLKSIEKSKVKPLVCGEPHRVLYHVTGYDTADHWCKLGRVALIDSVPPQQCLDKWNIVRAFVWDKQNNKLDFMASVRNVFYEGQADKPYGIEFSNLKTTSGLDLNAEDKPLFFKFVASTGTIKDKDNSVLPVLDFRQVTSCKIYDNRGQSSSVGAGQAIAQAKEQVADGKTAVPNPAPAAPAPGAKQGAPTQTPTTAEPQKQGAPQNAAQNAIDSLIEQVWAISFDIQPFENYFYQGVEVQQAHGNEWRLKLFLPLAQGTVAKEFRQELQQLCEVRNRIVEKAKQNAIEIGKLYSETSTQLNLLTPQVADIPSAEGLVSKCSDDIKKSVQQQNIITKDLDSAQKNLNDIQKDLAERTKTLQFTDDQIEASFRYLEEIKVKLHVQQNELFSTQTELKSSSQKLNQAQEAQKENELRVQKIAQQKANAEKTAQEKAASGDKQVSQLKTLTDQQIQAEKEKNTAEAAKRKAQADEEIKKFQEQKQKELNDALAESQKKFQQQQDAKLKEVQDLQKQVEAQKTADAKVVQDVQKLKDQTDLELITKKDQVAQLTALVKKQNDQYVSLQSSIEITLRTIRTYEVQIQQKRTFKNSQAAEIKTQQQKKETYDKAQNDLRYASKAALDQKLQNEKQLIEAQEKLSNLKSKLPEFNRLSSIIQKNRADFDQALAEIEKIAPLSQPQLLKAQKDLTDQKLFTQDIQKIVGSSEADIKQAQQVMLRLSKMKAQKVEKTENKNQKPQQRFSKIQDKKKQNKKTQHKKKQH